MAITVSLSTLLWVALLGVVAYIVYSLYQLFWVRPREFQKFWNDQGVRGTPYQFPLGTLPDIQRAADSDQIVQYAQKMANEYGLLQQQIVGCLCHIVVYDPQVVKHIMTSKAQFYHKASMSQKEIMRPLLHNGLLLSEDGYWRQQRTLLSPGFHFWYLQEMHSIIVSCIEGWAKQTGAQIDASPTGDVELEMSHELATQTLDSVATAAFGAGFRSDPKRADLFIHSLKQVLDNMQARTLNLVGFIPIIKQLPFPSYNAIKEGCANIDSIVGEIVRDRKEGRSKVVQGGEHAGSALLAERGEETRRRDLLDLLLDAQQNMPAGEVLTDRGVEEESINFIAAGAETTSNLCIWMLHRIITEPAAAPGQKTVLEKVRDEIDRVCQGELPTLEHLKELKYLEAVAYESLRLHPPAPTIPKYAIETHTMNMPDGRTLTIPEGTTMLMNANVIHRLEAYWPEPERFKPERFLAGGDADQGGDDGEKDGASPSPAPTPSPSPDGQKSSGASSGKTLTLEQKAIKAAQPFAFLGFSAGPRKCMPESDTRVLTDRGFLFLDEIEAYNAAHRRGDGPPLLFGCYDTEEQSLMYRPGTVVLSDPPERWVDFTDAHGQKHWDAGSSAFGVAAGVGAKGEVTSHVSLRVTPNHEMYVQVAARKMEGGHKHSARVPVLNNEEVPYQMVTAEELAPGYKCSCPADVLHPRGSKVTAETLCLHGYPVVRFLAAASAGITSQSFPVPCATLMPNPEDVSVGTERTEREHMDFIESPLHHVGLQTAAELDAFLEFYGYWLGDGSLSYTARSVKVSTVKDVAYLMRLLSLTGLSREKGQWYRTSRDEYGAVEFHIVEPRWFSYFDREYWVHYEAGRQLHLDRPSSSSESSPDASSSEEDGDSSASDDGRSDPSSSESEDDSPLPASASSIDAEFRLRELEARGMRRREVTSTKSAKWMFGWVLRRLDKRQARMVIEGLRVADATKAKQVKSEDETETSFTGANVIFTSSVAFRDALVQLCLHAGFSAFFDVNTTKGARDFQMRATRTHWAVRYDGTDDRAIRPVVDTKDVRFDGREMAPKKALTAFKPASALVASLLDNVVHSGTATELGKKIGVSPATITTARRKNALLTKGGYRIETKADYDARVAGSSAESESASDAESERASEGADAMPEMLYNAARDGRVWCVQVDHPDHLIVAQRAYRRAPGAIVTKASRPIIVGNCIGKNLAMIEIKIIFTLLFQRFNLSLVPGQHIAANAITRLPKNGIKFRIKRRTEAMALPLDEQELKAEAALRQRAVLKPLGMI